MPPPTQQPPSHTHLESTLVEVTNELYVDQFKGQFLFLIIDLSAAFNIEDQPFLWKHFLHLVLRTPLSWFSSYIIGHPFSITFAGSFLSP